MDISLLQGQLEIKENRGLEPFDTRFIDIATLVQNGNYEVAAIQAEEVLKEQIYDIRIIGYFLYGIFLEEGIKALKDIFDVFTSLLTENWDAIGPEKKCEKHTQTILTWLMKQLLKKLEYEEKKESDIWKLWQKEVSSEDVYKIRESLQSLRKVLSMKLEDLAEPILDNLLKVNKWLEAFEQLVYKESEPEREQGEDLRKRLEEQEVVETKDIGTEESKGKVKAQGAANLFQVTKSYKSTDRGVCVFGSHHLKTLIDKLEAFDILIQKEAFLQAAIVVEDINNIIKNFDPKKYFPTLFSRFCSLYALKVEEIIENFEYKDSPIWQALYDLYSVDIDSFVNMSEDMINMDSLASRDEEYEEEEYEDEEKGYYSEDEEELYDEDEKEEYEDNE